MCVETISVVDTHLVSGSSTHLVLHKYYKYHGGLPKVFRVKTEHGPVNGITIKEYHEVVHSGWYVVKATLVEAFRDTISLVRDAFLRRSPGTCTCTSEDAARKCMCCTAKPTSPRASSCSQSRLRFCLRALGGKSSVRKEVRCPPIQQDCASILGTKATIPIKRRRWRRHISAL